MEADVRKLKRQVASMNGLTIEGFQRSDSAGGMTFGDGARKISPIHIPPKTIVIVKKPLAADVTLIVREAKYDRSPPKKCEGTAPNVTCFYEWFGSDFEVYPPLGKEAIDYEGDEFEGVAEDAHPPKLDTVFHRCHREHSAWVLDLQAEGGASIAFVKIVDSVPPNSPSSKFLTVQPMKVDDVEGSPTFGKWIARMMGTEVAEVWPNYVAGHYLPMRFQTPDLIVPMTKVNGTQYVWQKNRMFLGQPLSSLPQSDCVVPIRP